VLEYLLLEYRFSALVINGYYLLYILRRSVGEDTGHAYITHQASIDTMTNGDTADENTAAANYDVSGVASASAATSISPEVRNPSSNSDKITYQAIESLMTISIAGFGGALCGLAISRRGGSISPLISGSRVSASTSVPVKRSRVAYYADHELPTAWAVACITFASIMEFSKMISPASNLQNLLLLNNQSSSDMKSASLNEKNNPSASQDSFVDKDLCLVVDYLLGGAAAGAAFKGSVIRTQASSKGLALRGGPVLPASVTAARSGILVGMIPGATLGFLAGLAVYSAIKLQHYAETVLIPTASGTSDSDPSLETEQQQISSDDLNRHKSNQ
jgi:hypothetical protein